MFDNKLFNMFKFTFPFNRVSSSIASKYQETNSISGIKQNRVNEKNSY